MSEQKTGDFASQHEVWKYISESENNKVQCVGTGQIVGFRNGELYSYTNKEYAELYMYHGKDWKKYTEPAVTEEEPWPHWDGAEAVVISCGNGRVDIELLELIDEGGYCVEVKHHGEANPQYTKFSNIKEALIAMVEELATDYFNRDE